MNGPLEMPKNFISKKITILVLDQVHFKKITMTGSRANFLSPEPNGQALWIREKSITFWPKCGIGEGDCDDDTDCSDNLICGNSNCGANFHPLADCCKEPNLTPEFSLTDSGKLWLIKKMRKGNNIIVDTGKTGEL